VGILDCQTFFKFQIAVLSGQSWWNLMIFKHTFVLEYLSLP